MPTDSRHHFPSSKTTPTTLKSHVRKRFGQHFLEPAWVAKLLECIQPAATELFLEVGPGAGELTLPIAATGARVIGVEVDRQLAHNLRRLVPPSVRVVTGDILRQDLPRLIAESDPRSFTRVVGNLPYNLSTPILRRLFEIQHTHLCFRDATLMLQREVADRLTGVPGSPAYGPLAVMTRVMADAKVVLSLPPGAFRPPPAVRSAVVALSFRPSPVTIENLPFFERLIRSLFTQRRKTVLNALRPFAETISPLPAQELLNQAGIDPGRRPGTLDLIDFARLAAILSDRDGKGSLYLGGN